jgi:streptomycin 6-kinase
MHSISWATGQGFARLLGQTGDAIVQEMAEFAEHCRVALHLDNSSMAATMIFLQRILQNITSPWRLTYITSVCLGVKFTTEGVLARPTSSCHRPVGSPFANPQLDC